MSLQLFVEPVPSLFRAISRALYWRRELITCYVHYLRRAGQGYICISTSPGPHYLRWAERIDSSSQVVFCLVTQNQYLTIVWDGPKLISLMLSADVPKFLFDGLREKQGFQPVVYVDETAARQLQGDYWHSESIHFLTQEQVAVLGSDPYFHWAFSSSLRTILICSVVVALGIILAMHLGRSWLSVQHLEQKDQLLPPSQSLTYDTFPHFFLLPERIKRAEQLYHSNYHIELREGILTLASVKSLTTDKVVKVSLPNNRALSADIQPVNTWILAEQSSDLERNTGLHSKQLQSYVSQSFINQNVTMQIDDDASNRAEIIIRNGWIEDLATLAFLFQRLGVTLTAASIFGLESEVSGTMSVTWRD